MNRNYQAAILRRGPILTLMLAAVLASLLAAPLPAQATHGAPIPPTAPNPPLAPSCGLNIAVVIDHSSSITSPFLPPFLGDPANPGKIKTATNGFVDALTGTPSEIGVFSFASVATTELGATDVRNAAGGATVKAAVDGVNFNNPPGTGGTNWEAAFNQTAGQNPELIVFITDGNPTVHTGDNDGLYQDDDLAAGVEASNARKAGGSRVVAVGISTGVDPARLQAVSGPIEGEDWFFAQDFDELEQKLRDLVIALCGPSVNVLKTVNGTPTAGWQFAVNVTPPPAAINANPADGVTDAGGAVSFKWESAGPTTVELTETPQAGFALDSVTCTDQTGAAVATTPITNGVSLQVGQFDIVNCEVKNIEAPGELTLLKEPSTAVAQVGDTITYTYTVTNSGGVTIDNIVLDDNVLGMITLAATTLAPGESTTGTATATVAAADLPGPLDNIGTVTGTDPQGTPVTATDDASVPLAALDLKKVVNNAVALVGDTVTYTYTVTNIGGVTLTDVSVDDDKLGAITLATTTLAPGEATTGTATTTITTTNLPGPLVNTAVATGKGPDDRPVTSPPATAEVAIPSIAIAKVVSVQSASVGQTVTYTYTVTNNGGVPLTNVAVSDDKLGAITLAKTTLAPGEATTGTATYTITSADAANVPLVNIATATGVTPDGKTVTAQAQAQIPTIVLQAATPTTVAVLPQTGAQAETAPTTAIGIAILLAGLLLVVAARRRIVALTRMARRPIPRDAVDWAQHNLGMSRARAFGSDAREWARRMLGGGDRF